MTGLGPVLQSQPPPSAASPPKSGVAVLGGVAVPPVPLAPEPSPPEAPEPSPPVASPPVPLPVGRRAVLVVDLHLEGEVDRSIARGRGERRRRRGGREDTFGLDGELFEGVAFTLEDEGGNRCGCPEPTPACKVLTSDLEPPGRVH